MYYPSKKCNKTTIKVIELKKGDAVIFDSRLWHGSLKSLSGKLNFSGAARAQ